MASVCQNVSHVEETDRTSLPRSARKCSSTHQAIGDDGGVACRRRPTLLVFMRSSSPTKKCELPRGLKSAISIRILAEFPNTWRAGTHSNTINFSVDARHGNSSIQPFPAIIRIQQAPESRRTSHDRVGAVRALAEL